MPNQICLRGTPNVYEGKANAILTPGELLAWSADDELDPHGTAAGNATPVMVAIENDLIGDGIDDNYAAGDTVRYVVPAPGDVLYMWLADGENVIKGDPLESDGNGDLQKHTPQAVDEGGTATYTVYEDSIVGIADEDLNNSAGGARARIRVRIR